MRIVLDTNVAISAIISSGAPNRILRLAETGTIRIAISQEILEELSGVLRRGKFRPYLAQAGLTPYAAYRAYVALVHIFPVTQSLTVITKDPSDNMFLACAVISGASFIISGDRHLLALNEFQGIKIVTPRQFLKTFFL